MIIYPAIDILDGQVVRLRQGRAEERTIYSDDPVAFALGWKNGGASWLHIVDLGGAFQGAPQALETAAAIARATSLPCQLGGGIRTLQHIASALDAGITRVIIGSKAVQSPAFLAEAVAHFGSERIALGIDAKDGLVALHGWVDVSQIRADDLARRAFDSGVRTIIFTDIATDGMLRGPNLAAMRAMRDAVPAADLIASGGVSSLHDIRNLAAIPGLHGAIVGRALFDKLFTLPEALAAAAQAPGTHATAMDAPPPHNPPAPTPA